MLIRSRRDADLPALAAVLRAVHDHDGYPDVWPDDPQAFVRAASPLAAWVAEVEGQVAGQVLLVPVARPHDWPVTPDPAGRAAPTVLVEVKRLFVRPDLRGHGVARALMDAALTLARQGGRLAVLQTRDDNAAANRFYVRSGWRALGTAPAPWTTADGTHPLVRLYAAPTDPQTPSDLEARNIKRPD